MKTKNKEEKIEEIIDIEEKELERDVETEELGESEEALILKNKIEGLEEKVRYVQAELINYRKRKDEEVSNLLKFANQDIIMDILPLVDNFERAIKLSSNTSDETNKFLDGFRILYNNLATILRRYEVEEINPIGEEFDPKLHEALLVEEDKEKEDGIVLEVLIKGYTLKGRVIRPASVKVNKLN